MPLPYGQARAGVALRSEAWAYAFCVLGFFGVAGIHRFYAGKTGTGLLWLLTGGLLCIGTIVDLFLIPEMIGQKNRELAALATGTPGSSPIIIEAAPAWGRTLKIVLLVVVLAVVALVVTCATAFTFLSARERPVAIMPLTPPRTLSAVPRELLGTWVEEPPGGLRAHADIELTVEADGTFALVVKRNGARAGRPPNAVESITGEWSAAGDEIRFRGTVFTNRDSWSRDYGQTFTAVLRGSEALVVRTQAGATRRFVRQRAETPSDEAP